MDMKFRWTRKTEIYLAVYRNGSPAHEASPKVAVVRSHFKTLFPFLGNRQKGKKKRKKDHKEKQIATCPTQLTV